MLHLIHVWLSISFSGGVRLQHLSAAKNYIYRYRERSVPKMRDTFFFFPSLYMSLQLYLSVQCLMKDCGIKSKHKSQIQILF